MEAQFDHNMLPGSLELAYIGDSIYELYVREKLVRRGGRVQRMHKAATTFVCAHAQSEAMLRIQETLTQTEADVARRARNAHQNPPRNANPAEYHRATALEALVGYLYLTNQHQRLEELLALALPDVHMEALK